MKGPKFVTIFVVTIFGRFWRHLDASLNLACFAGFGILKGYQKDTFFCKLPSVIEYWCEVFAYKCRVVRKFLCWFIFATLFLKENPWLCIEFVLQFGCIINTNRYIGCPSLLWISILDETHSRGKIAVSSPDTNYKNRVSFVSIIKIIYLWKRY